MADDLKGKIIHALKENADRVAPDPDQPPEPSFTKNKIFPILIIVAICLIIVGIQFIRPLFSLAPPEGPWERYILQLPDPPPDPR